MKDIALAGGTALCIGAGLLTFTVLEDTLGNTPQEVVDATYTDDSFAVSASRTGVIAAAGMYIGIRAICWGIRQLRKV